MKLLLTTRKDIFDEYTKTGFESAFSKCFEIIKCKKIIDSDRELYLMKRR